jgi:catalase (peroxidase I)
LGEPLGDQLDERDVWPPIAISNRRCMEGRGSRAHIACVLACPTARRLAAKSLNLSPEHSSYNPAVENLDWDAVKADIAAALVDSQEHWPADFGHYGGLMIRMAWVWRYHRV